MKGLIAGLVAAAILWTTDVELNDGRYTDVIKQTVVGFVSR
jgi:hypothetical protein